jgi:hypothetical protein
MVRHVSSKGFGDGTKTTQHSLLGESYLTHTYSKISGASSCRCIGIARCLRYNQGSFTQFLENTLDLKSGEKGALGFTNESCRQNKQKLDMQEKKIRSYRGRLLRFCNTRGASTLSIPRWGARVGLGAHARLVMRVVSGSHFVCPRVKW